METIKEFLESNIYLDIIKKLGVDNFRKELRSIEIERLINRLKQRQFLIEGFNGKLHSEKEFVEFYKQKIEKIKEILSFGVRSFGNTAMMPLKNIQMANSLKVNK
ncbi:TPA: hypothetical protein TUV19_002036 [Streptococcus equi subsp. zooepidemicus]|nr:hypothetical protein [Streptococcus equi subsp. zooepidemicus]HEL0650977.1 hypothetical protein [Streptococcus equi subsp. zooepidemicus]